MAIPYGGAEQFLSSIVPEIWKGIATPVCALARNDIFLWRRYGYPIFAQIFSKRIWVYSLFLSAMISTFFPALMMMWLSEKV